ncbi:glycine betaine ABC transporter substrate-binding protein [Planosporangium sp. 12N6]|uniref:glycine betaine ABC transporter substrate-binding protein n=1 Tax=Planosporangium spinosum TaxID=3402278 RepID=UPI003CF948B7
MRAALGIAVGVAAVGLVAGCGKAGSSGTRAAQDVQGAGCAPVAGQQLVMLTDDKKWQVADNVIPAVNAKAASPALIAALDKVSTAVGPAELAALNKATDIDRKTAKVAAEEFAASKKLTDGIAKGGSGQITVGTANFNENQTLGELYRIALEAAGYQATVQQIGNRELYEPSLEKGDIQVVPEYTGTLTEFLNKKVNGGSADQLASGDLDKTVTALKGLGSRAGLAFGKPAQAADQNAFAVTSAFADKYKVKTLSDFAATCSGKATVLGGPPECPQRPLCQQGLEQVYKVQFGRFASLDAGGPQTKTALTGGTVSIGLVLSSDAAFATD